MLFRATVLPCSNLRSPLCSARARLALAVGAHPVPMPSAAASARRDSHPFDNEPSRGSPREQETSGPGPPVPPGSQWHDPYDPEKGLAGLLGNGFRGTAREELPSRLRLSAPASSALFCHGS